MRVGFEASDLFPGRGGLYTYASELLRHLDEVADPPALTLLDGYGRHSLRQLLQANNGVLPTTRYLRARPWPLLSSGDGPWRRSYYGRHAAALIDRYALEPLWRRADGIPALARWHLPGGLFPPLDVCHWPFEEVFVRLPAMAHVATIHDLIVLRYPQWLTPRYVEEHTTNLTTIARYATRLIADSESTRRDIVALLDVPSERIDVVPLAAGAEFAPPSPSDRTRHDDVLARYGLREGDYVLSWGIISERKNVVRLATAFKRVIESNPGLTTRLVLAGGWGWMAEPIQQGLAALGLGERLIMPGRVPREDLPSLIQGARAVAYPSLYEGFGLPPLEAMACGTPVVASNISSVPEVVGDAALLVAPYSVEDIAAALERALTDDALRAELAARGPRRAVLLAQDRRPHHADLPARRRVTTAGTDRTAIDASRHGVEDTGLDRQARPRHPRFQRA